VFFRANWNIGGTQEFTEPTAVGFFSSTIDVKMSKGNLLEIDVVTYAANTFTNLKLEILEVPFAIIGTTLNFGVVMPPIKVSDFINGFLKTYNAVLIPVSDTEFGLHNIDDYYALGVKKDWTRYIDMVDIKHEKVPIPKQITMSHAEGEDIANVQYTSINNQAFGSMKASPEVDFADEALEIESPLLYWCHRLFGKRI
jgi:hypothetical protein